MTRVVGTQVNLVRRAMPGKRGVCDTNSACKVHAPRRACAGVVQDASNASARANNKTIALTAAPRRSMPDAEAHHEAMTYSIQEDAR
jgi:hypothetical protein